MDFKYKTTFDYDISAQCAIRDIRKDLKVSSASLAQLKGLIPEDIDLNTNVDLMGVAFPFAVVNQFNANDDAIDTETALAIKSSFLNKPMNVEHYRWEIIGHVVSSHFTDHYTNEVLPEVANRTDIFDMALGAVVYKLAESRYVEIIKEAHGGNASDEALSTSWEIGFNEFKIGVGGKNLEDCEIITDPAQIEEMRPLLKAFGGAGETEDGRRVRRIITGKALGLGGGFTFSPAADVKGVYIEKAPQEDIEEEEEEEEDYAEKYKCEEESIFDDHEKVISSADEFTREELIGVLGELLQDWEDKEHPYYKDLMLFVGDIMVEEEKEEAVATYDFDEILASLGKMLKKNLR